MACPRLQPSSIRDSEVGPLTPSTDLFYLAEIEPTNNQYQLREEANLRLYPEIEPGCN